VAGGARFAREGRHRRDNVGLSVLCVDDDRNLCEILSKTLVGEGYHVRTAHDGEAALHRLQERPADLVLLDLLLPKRDGFSVLETLRAAPAPLSTTPVVLISGCSRTPQYVERAKALGVAEFLTKPVPLEELLEVTAKHARRRKSAQKGARPSAAAAKPLAGELADVAFPALLHHLHGLRATGVLRLESGKKKKALALRDGRPLAVKSNLVNECLGNLLVRMGQISPEQMAESVRRVKRGEGLQGDILVAMQLLSVEDVAAALAAQAEEKLLEIFEWPNGRFHWEMGARLEGGNALALGKSSANIVLIGARGRVPIEAVDAFLEARGHLFVGQGESPFYRFQEIDLDSAEQLLLRALDGTMRLRDLGDQGESIRRTLYGLFLTEMLELREEAAPAQRAAAPSPSPVLSRSSSAPSPERGNDPADSVLRAELAQMAARMRGKNYFEVLEVPESVTDEGVRRAYVELAKKTHPDRYSNASDAVRRLSEEIFGLVSKAHETLSDSRRRTEYLLERKRGERAAAELEEGQRAVQAELQFQQGEVKLKRRDFPGAVECFQWAVKLYPEEGEYHAHLGWAKYLAEPNDKAVLKEALENVKKGAKLAPDREKPYLYLGRLYQAAGRTDIAEKMFARCVQIKSDCVEALRELRLMHMRREKEKGLIGRLLRR
jgi:CheY-like chemotaxis protein/curved DNA-binding protein CbpA